MLKNLSLLAVLVFLVVPPAMALLGFCGSLLPSVPTSASAPTTFVAAAASTRAAAAIDATEVAETKDWHVGQVVINKLQLNTKLK